MNISSIQNGYFTGYGATTVARGATFTIATASMVAATESDETVPASQTIEEYKQDFMAKIQAISIHPSQAGARQSISIADGLWAKMQADPELEKQVLAQIESDLTAAFAVEPAFTTMRFDENGVYAGTAGGSAHMAHYEREAADAFWKRGSAPATGSSSKDDEAKARKAQRKERREKTEKLLDELAAQRRQAYQAAQEGRRDVSLGIADYVRGSSAIVRPSIIESLL